MSKEEKQISPIWKDFKVEKPACGQVVIILTKLGMHFYQYLNDDPLNTYCGIFFISRNGSDRGLLYSVEMADITHWIPLPEVYES